MSRLFTTLALVAVLVGIVAVGAYSRLGTSGAANSPARRVVGSVTTSVTPPVPPHTWPMWHYTGGNNAYNEYEKVLTVTNLSKLVTHTLPIDAPGDLIAGGLVFQTGLSLTATSLISNTVVWSYPDQTVYAAIDGGTIFAAVSLSNTGSANEVVALADKTGGVKWTWKAPSGAYLGSEPPIVGDGVVGLTAGSLTGLDAKTGQLLWQMSGNSGNWLAYGAFAGKPAFYAAIGPDLYAFNPRTGKTQWHWKNLNNENPHMLIYGNGQLYLTSDNHLYAFTDKGKLRWTLGEELVLSAEGHGLVYGVVTVSGGSCHISCSTYVYVEAHDTSAGAQVWRIDASTINYSGQASAITGANGLLYVATDSGLAVLDGSSGQVVTTLSTAPYYASWDPVVVDSRIFVGGLYFGLK